MADYHLSAKIIGRSSGRSATAAAAYRAAERIFDRRTGIEHDYSRKQGVVRSEVLLPRDAPELYRDRSELWNAVEESERRSNSQLAREFNAALPRELSRDDQWELARSWAERELVGRGMCADLCMHDRGDGNPHVHIMATTREVGPDGFTAKNREWNDKNLLLEWRKSWEVEQNRALERHYERERTPERDRAYVDCRSYADRGIEREATVHEGPAVRAMERKEQERCVREGREYAPATDRARENEQIVERNAALERLREGIDRVQERARELARFLRTFDPQRERMRRNVERVRDMARDMDGRGAGVTREAREAYDGLSRRERRMLHRACPRGLSPTIDRLSADRHARKPLVERSVERERERASADREAGRGQATGRGGKPMRRRDYERAVEHEERSRYMEQEQEPERDRDWW